MVSNSGHLIRLSMNLVDNAAKYTVHGEIKILAKEENVWIQVVIADTWIGILPEHLEYLFDRFYRVERSSSIRGNR